jgi:hypothetical protein
LEVKVALEYEGIEIFAKLYANGITPQSAVIGVLELAALYFPPMPIVEKHAPGSFCWIELATSDQKAAKDFYGQLFGWSANDSPLAPGDFYTIFQLEGRAAAAAYSLRKDQKEQGVASHWMLYVAVENADATAKKVDEVRGKVLCPPFEVDTYGKMAVIQDPTGPVFSIWEPRANQGTGIAGVGGTLCWADLSSPDPARASKFYSDLFGWKVTSDTDDKSGYQHIQNGEDFIGGILPNAEPDAKIPPHWLPYFMVANCDMSAAKAKEIGAGFLLPPTTMENVGRMAVVVDPQEAVFAIFQPMRKK